MFELCDADKIVNSVQGDQVSDLRGTRTTTTEQGAFIATASETLPQQESPEASTSV